MEFDLVVIGSGPGGQKAALQAAKAGKKTAIVERYPLIGGGCTHFGTLPSKSIRESMYRWSMGSSGSLGQELDRAKTIVHHVPDILKLMKRKERVILDESEVVSNQLRRNKIKVFHGEAIFLDAHTIDVKMESGSQQLTSHYFVIATGASPIGRIQIPIDGKRVFDSDAILKIDRIPKSMVVLGAGIIGAEYASMFAMAGTKIYLVDNRNEILSSVDREIVEHLVERFNHQQVEVILESETTHIEQSDKGVKVSLSSKRVIEVDCVLTAMGRQGNTKGMGLEKLGITLDKRSQIAVDPSFRTTVSNIFAVGDVVGFPALASTSMEQGRIATCNAFSIKDQSGKMPQFYPFGIYTIPEISMIGPTEQDLVKAGNHNFVVGRAFYRELARGQIVGDKWGLLKMLVDKDSLKVLGVHIVGDSAAELIHIGQAVMTLGGTVRYFIDNVFNYPTFAEAYKTAAFKAINSIQK